MGTPRVIISMVNQLQFDKAVSRWWIRVLLFLATCGLLVSSPTVRAQTGSTLVSGPQPPDAPTKWKQLVGIYEYQSDAQPKHTTIVLERNGHLFLQAKDTAKADKIQEDQGQLFIPGSDGRTHPYGEQRNKSGAVTSFSYRVEHFVRTDAGTDPARFYHITLTKPIEQLRASALAAKPPGETGSHRKPDLVELAALDPSIHLDIRYAQSNNFLSTPVYTQARAFMQGPAAEALLRVLRKLEPLGYGLLIHDAYRPWYVTKIFWDATPPEDHIFVADPEKGSRHNRGCAVDLTLYDLATGKAIEMTGLYDEMSPRSFPNFPGGTSLQRWHRDLLRRAMESEAFAVNENEWWHFDYKDWKSYAILNVGFENLGLAASRP
jgi:D-alanyl-D-alanine dipeptidase